METFASLFDGAGDDAEAEARLRAVTAAQVEAQDCWAFLALARSDAEFGHRLALSEDRLASIAARHGVSYEDVTAQFRTAFEALHPKESASEREAAGAVSCKNCGHSNPTHRKGGLCPCGCESYQPDVHRAAAKEAGRDEWEHDCTNCGQTTTSTREHMDCPNCGEKAEEVYTSYKGKSAAKHALDPSCPNCGSGNVTYTIQPGGSGSGPGGSWRMGDQGGQEVVQCKDCGKTSPHGLSRNESSRTAGKRGPSYDPDSVDDLTLNGTSSNPIYYYNEGYDHGRSGADYKGYGGRDKAVLYGHGYRHGNKDSGGKESAKDAKGHEYRDNSWGSTCKNCGMDKPESGEWVPDCNTVQSGFGDHEGSRKTADASQEMMHQYQGEDQGSGGGEQPQQGGAKPSGGGGMHLPGLPKVPKIPGMGGGAAAGGEAAGAGELLELAPLLLAKRIAGLSEADRFDANIEIIKHALAEGEDPLGLLYDTSAPPTPSHHETTEQFEGGTPSALDAAMQQGGGSAQPENPGGHSDTQKTSERKEPVEKSSVCEHSGTRLHLEKKDGTCAFCKHPLAETGSQKEGSRPFA